MIHMPPSLDEHWPKYLSRSGGTNGKRTSNRSRMSLHYLVNQLQPALSKFAYRIGFNKLKKHQPRWDSGQQAWRESLYTWEPGVFDYTPHAEEVLEKTVNTLVPYGSREDRQIMSRILEKAYRHSTNLLGLSPPQCLATKNQDSSYRKSPDPGSPG